jgi:hypothetical protein
MTHHFNHRFGDYALATLSGKEVRQIPTPSHDTLSDAAYVVQSRYWVARPDVEEALRPGTSGYLIGLRDVAASVDERTLLVSVIPQTAVGHTMPLILSTSSVAHCLPALLASFAADYVARQKVGGTHVTFFVLKQVAVPTPGELLVRAPWDGGRTIAEWIGDRSLEAHFTAWDLVRYGEALGYQGPPFRWDPSRRELLRAELDAAFFLLYGIERDDVDYIMDTFPIVRRKDEAAHGEYRTKRLILERYDALAEAAANGTEYQTVLDPPPADPRVAHPESSRPSWA